VLQLSSLEYVESQQKAGKKPKPATKAITKEVRVSLYCLLKINTSHLKVHSDQQSSLSIAECRQDKTSIAGQNASGPGHGKGAGEKEDKQVDWRCQHKEL
jgi:hypothetical protein